MNEKEYKKIVKKYTPKEKIFKNSIKSFIIGGSVGMLGQGLIDLYTFIFKISKNEAGIYMIITLIFLGCLFTALGFFDKVFNFSRCGLIIPITGFAHSMQSAALEYKSEGLITGIGANIFKLAGAVILYGIISAYIFGFIRIILG